MEQTSTGIKPNIAAFLSYLFAWVSGLIIYIVETKNQFVRFHAAQSVIVFGGISVATFILSFIPFLGWAVNAFLGLLALLLWILLMIKALQGERYKLPVVGNIAEQWADRKI